MQNMVFYCDYDDRIKPSTQAFPRTLVHDDV